MHEIRKVFSRPPVIGSDSLSEMEYNAVTERLRHLQQPLLLERPAHSPLSVYSLRKPGEHKQANLALRLLLETDAKNPQDVLSEGERRDFQRKLATDRGVTSINYALPRVVFLGLMLPILWYYPLRSSSILETIDRQVLTSWRRNCSSPETYEATAALLSMIDARGPLLYRGSANAPSPTSSKPISTASICIIKAPFTAAQQRPCGITLPRNKHTFNFGGVRALSIKVDAAVVEKVRQQVQVLGRYDGSLIGMLGAKAEEREDEVEVEQFHRRQFILYMTMLPDIPWDTKHLYWCWIGLLEANALFHRILDADAECSQSQWLEEERQLYARYLREERLMLLSWFILGHVLLGGGLAGATYWVLKMFASKDSGAHDLTEKPS